LAKKQQITLSIPEPCHEGWDNMTANEQGRHCSSCNKTVIDFSLYSDRQLIEFFKKSQGNVCGRLNSYQVDNTIVVIEHTNRSFFYKLFMGSAFASWLGAESTATAQSYVSPPKIQKTLVQVGDSNKKNKNSLSFIKGQLLDSATKQPIPFSNVKLKNGDSEIGEAVSDIDGYFKFDVPKELKNKNLTIIAVYVGYSDKTVNLNLTHLPFYIAIKLKSDYRDLKQVEIMPRDHFMGLVSPQSTSPVETGDYMKMSVIEVFSVNESLLNDTIKSLFNRLYKDPAKKNK
jgi:hypothetical protein